MSRTRHKTRLWMTTVLANVGAAYPGFALALQATDPGYGVDIDAINASQQADEVLFEADSVYRDAEDGPIVAEGNVRAFFGDRYLRADRLTYNPETDVVTADGNVSVTDANLETVFADTAILSGDLRDGLIENFTALLSENARLAAESAVQEQGAKTRLNRAVYTACDVCNGDGEAKTPTWRIKSLRVVRDAERKVVRFYHAFLQIKGVPILYTPYLQGPDPTVERQSGFLTPRIGTSTRLGFNFELPYYLALSNSQDATFFPKYTAKDGVLWQGEYRRRGNRGYHAISGGFIDFTDTVTSIPTTRWHVFGRGVRDFGENLRFSYDFERVSDKSYLRRYNIERRGDLSQELNRGQTNQLRSNARITWSNGGSRLTMDTYAFQGLRSTDETSTTPFILPLIDFRHDFSGKVVGGDVSIGANIGSVYRSGGTDSQRFTVSANWDREMITDGGHRFALFAEARGDAYTYQDLDQGTEILPGLPGETTSFETRFVPSAGVEWSYPLSRTVGRTRLFLEPRVQLVASPSNIDNSGIINEDSQSIEFDYAGLFDFNKATGFDAFEDGQRANIGVAASAALPNGMVLEGSIGQQFRLQSTNAFTGSSGLGGDQSDIVGSLNFRYNSTLGIENRFRIDNDTGDLQRAESMAFVSTGPVRATVSYVRLNEENIAANLVRREELYSNVRFKVARNWSVGGSWRLDLEQNQTIRQAVMLGYEDECARFGITYGRDRTFDTNLEPNTSVLLTFSLKSLMTSAGSSGSWPPSQNKLGKSTCVLASS